MKFPKLFKQLENRLHHLDATVHLSTTTHQLEYSFHSVAVLISLKQPIIVEIQLQQPR